MPNNLDKNTSKIIMRQFLKGFESNRILTKTVNRQTIKGKLTPKTGSTIQIKRPHQFNAIETPDGDITGMAKNGLTAATATASVGNMITVACEWSLVEEALELDQLDTILKPASTTMATRLESNLANFMLKNGALSLGNPGTNISQWSDIASVGSLLTDLGVTGTNYAAINVWAAQNLTGQQINLTDNNLVRTAWTKAQIPRNFAGVQAIASNGLVMRTQGDFGGTLTVKTAPNVGYTTVKDTYQFDVTLTGATANKTGFLKTADQLVFTDVAWVNQETKQALIDAAGNIIPFTATVMADANSDASGNVVLHLSGVPIVDADNPQYNTVNTAVLAGAKVTVKGVAKKTIKPSLFYNEDFVGIGSVVLPKLHSIDSSIITYDNLSIRMHKYSNGDAATQMIRFDLLPSFACFNPMLGGPLFGQA